MDERSNEEGAAYRRDFEEARADGAAPGPGQEPSRERPPRVEPAAEALRVEHGGVVVAATARGLRVIEAGGAAAYYFPPDDVKRVFLTRMRYSTVCAWRGAASYWTLNVRGRESEAAAWSYESPGKGYERIAGYIGFYTSRVDACYAGEQRVQPQPGAYFGGRAASGAAGSFEGG